MKNENHITVCGWMVNELNLKGNELLAYAIVYGFSQDGESWFLGSSKYISDSLSVSRPTAIKVLESLVNKNLLVKKQEKINDVVFNRYKVNLQPIKFLYRGSKETLQGGYKETLQGGSKETLYSNTNKELLNKNNKENIQEKIANDYNKICLDLPKVTKMTEARKKKIKTRLKSFTYDQLLEAFKKAQASDFVRSGNWCNFDWITKSDENVIKLLEGNYDNKGAKNDIRRTSATTEKPKLYEGIATDIPVEF